MRRIGGSGEAGVQLSDIVFAAPFREPLVHQVLTAYRAEARQGSRAQKSRSDKRGGGAKPWRQKGTGRARAGTIRSPLWRGGGVTFAARPRDYSQKVNRKMHRAALRSILSELLRRDRLILVEEFRVKEPRTRAALALLGELGLRDALIVADDPNWESYMAVRNLPNVELVRASEIDPYSLIAHEKVLMTQAALREVEAWLS